VVEKNEFNYLYIIGTITLENDGAFYDSKNVTD